VLFPSNEGRLAEYDRFTLTFSSCIVLYGSSSVRAAIADRSGVTELPRLTSDSILTADRRGGILISFGRNRRSSGVLNPFGPCFVQLTQRMSAASFTSHPSSRMYIRASDRSRAESRIRRGDRLPLCTRPGYIRARHTRCRRSTSSTGRDGVPASAPGNGRRERGGVRHVVRISIECPGHT
jgi:hypothetical protein